MRKQISYKDRVCIVTGSGAGLGRVYALELSKRGGKLVINDMNKEAADSTVKEITDLGQEAIANYSDVAKNGAEIVQAAIDKWGQIDILVNNAGIIRDGSFKKMTDEQWDIVIKVHLYGTFNLIKAAWPHMQNAKFGRILNISSPSGLYGNFGQVNYAAAKMGIVGLSTSIAQEGAKKNIHCNVLAPNALTDMSKGVIPSGLNITTEQVGPIVAMLCDPEGKRNGKIYENGGGWIGCTQVQQSKGVAFEFEYTAEDVRDKLSQIEDFSSYDVVSDNLPYGMFCVSKWLGTVEEARVERSSRQSELRSNFLPYPDLFDTLIKFDRWLGKYDGRKVVDHVNAVFQIRVEDDQIVVESIERFLVMDFREGQLYIGKARNSDVQLEFKSPNDLLQFLNNSWKGHLDVKGDQHAFQRLGEIKLPDFGHGQKPQPHPIPQQLMSNKLESTVLKNMLFNAINNPQVQKSKKPYKNIL